VHGQLDEAVLEVVHGVHGGSGGHADSEDAPADESGH
jgi:hypothetical protein